MLSYFVINLVETKHQRYESGLISQHVPFSLIFKHLYHEYVALYKVK